MALTEETVEDKIEVVGDHKIVQVRTATVIKKDGTEINRSFHRHQVSPSVKTDSGWSDTDISGEDASVQAVCNAVWTSTIKSSYETFADSQETP